MKTFFLIIVGLCVIGLLLSFNFSFNKVYGDFMNPTFNSGDTLIFKKAFLGNFSPDRADIVVYKNSSGQIYLGRVIALPLEEVRVENGNVYIKNDQAWKLTEKYLPAGTQTQAVPENQWVKLNQFQYLVAGDNRMSNLIDLQNDLINKSQIRGIFIHKL